MTYTMKNNCGCCAQSGFGSYYTYGSGQVYGAPLGGLGATDAAFNADQVWADVEEGSRAGQYQKEFEACVAVVMSGGDSRTSAEGKCAAAKSKVGTANFRGGRAADAIRKALNALGYGPLTLGVPWGAADKAAWDKYTTDRGVPAGPGLVSKAGVNALAEDMGTKTAGLGKLGWAALLLLGAAGTVALVSGRKRTPGARTGRAHMRLRG